MKSWGWVLPMVLALVAAPACFWGPGGELGTGGRLRFDTPMACFWGCDQLRGIAVGTDVRVGISDAECYGDDASFSVSVTGSALEVVDGPSPVERSEGGCWTYVTVRAVAEGSGSLAATSPSGDSDSYPLFAAQPTTITVPDGIQWASRAEAAGFEIEVGEGWWESPRVTDASFRPLVYDDTEVTWESSDAAIMAPTPAIGGRTVLSGRAPGQTTITGRYRELEVTVDVTVVAPEP